MPFSITIYDEARHIYLDKQSGVKVWSFENGARSMNDIVNDLSTVGDNVNDVEVILVNFFMTLV